MRPAFAGTVGGTEMNGRIYAYVILMLVACVLFISPMSIAARSPDVSTWFDSYTRGEMGHDISMMLYPYDGIVKYTNEIRLLDHDLTVEKGTLLDLENTTLILKPTRNGSLKIEVLDGGALFVNNSRILSEGYAYNFLIHKNASFHMSGSLLRGCGYEGGDISTYGPWINSNSNRIENCTIEGNYYGLVFDHAEDNVIINCTIRRNSVGLYMNSSSGDVMAHNTVCDNIEGVRIERSRVNVISDNVISGNVGRGLAIGRSSDINVLTNNTIDYNGEGIWLQGSVSNSLTKNRLEGNGGPAIWLESARVNFIGNNTLYSNGYGIYLHSSGENAMTGNTACFNVNDGVFLDDSNNNVMVNNNASYNGGYGFNVTNASKRTYISRSNNVAAGNTKGDYLIPDSALTLFEISLLSIVFAFADKTLYLIDFQKIIITNIFSGVVSPIRDPLQGSLEKVINRVYSMLGIKRWGYKNAHISGRFGFLFMHFVDGDEIRSTVYMPTYRNILSNELVLSQIRFVDVLLRDRVVLLRNIAYFGLMTLIGMAVYYGQVIVGTFRWPYLLPIVIQFSIMFIIGLIIQSSIVGRSQRIKYEIGQTDSADRLRREAREQMDALDDHHQDGKVTDRRYEEEREKLIIVRDRIEYMDARKEYLRFDQEGYLKAIAAYERLLVDDPDHPLFLAGLSEACAMLGLWMRDNGEDAGQYFERAMLAAEKASDVDDRTMEVLRAKAISQYCAGKLQESDEEIKAALLANGRDAESYYFLSLLKVDSSVRMKLLEKAVALDQDLVIARRDLGSMLISQAKYDKAAVQFAYVLKRHDDPVAHRFMGYIYYKQGKTNKALAEYRRALELYPGYKAAISGLEEAEKVSAMPAIVV